MIFFKRHVAKEYFLSIVIEFVEYDICVQLKFLLT